MAAGVEDDPADIEALIRRSETRLKNLLNIGADSCDTAVREGSARRAPPLGHAASQRDGEKFLWGWDDLEKLEQLKPAALRHVLTTVVEALSSIPKRTRWNSRSITACP
jgi:hypothetical protein